MSKNKLRGEAGGFFQHQSHLGFSGIGGGMINSFDERRASQHQRDRMDYERAAMMQQQHQVRYTQDEITRNKRLVADMEKELEEQELVNEDEDIYYLLT